MYHKSKEKVRLDEYIYVQIVRSVDIYNNKKVRSVEKISQNICVSRKKDVTLQPKVAKMA